MKNSFPFASHEVRWFFEGKAEEHNSLKTWFEKTSPIRKSSGVRPPVWKGRRNDQPDVYLLLPGYEDMGIKWREGQLQIKGRLSCLGTQVFCGRHQGKVERWIKWSYTGVPAPYQQLFSAGGEAGLITVSVSKTRALRKVRLDTLTGEAVEVDAGTFVDRGLGIELTDIEVADTPYCSLAIEAFPNDSTLSEAFTGTAEAFFEVLTDFDLDARWSKSYPAFLAESLNA